MKQIVNIFKWLLILAVVLGFAFLVYAVVKINKPFKTSGPNQEFDVGKGSTTKLVAQNLYRAGLISRPVFFELDVYFRQAGSKIQAGVYELSPAMSIREIVQTLTSGKVLDTSVKLTIVEGWDAADIAGALEAAGITGKKTFLDYEKRGAQASPELAKTFTFLQELPPGASLEGFLFPDTYFFSKGSSVEAIAGKMLDDFDRKLTPDLRAQIKAHNQDIFSIVTMASLIEREVGRNASKLSDAEFQKLQQERRLVASVFYNRLQLGMPLESDATIAYITGSKSNRATIEQTKIDSPYNTYKYKGLPPGPIASPSLDAIAAAITPAQSDYLYFVSAPDGTAYFAKTLQEHNANKQKYLGQ